MPTPGSTEVAGPKGSADIGHQEGSRGGVPSTGTGSGSPGSTEMAGDMGVRNEAHQAGGRGNPPSTGDGKGTPGAEGGPKDAS